MWLQTVICIYLSFLLYLFFRSIISICTKQCSVWLVVQTMECSVPIWTDMGGFWKQIKAIQWRAWSLWCDGSRKQKGTSLFGRLSLRPLFLPDSLITLKKKKSLKTFCTLMKNSFDIYFCCFLLSCWVSQLILQYTYTQKNAAVYFALYCQCYCLMPRWFPSTLAIELVVLLEGQ